MSSPLSGVCPSCPPWQGFTHPGKRTWNSVGRGLKGLGCVHRFGGLGRMDRCSVHRRGSQGSHCAGAACPAQVLWVQGTLTSRVTVQVWRVSCLTLLVFKASVPGVYLLCSGQGQFSSSNSSLVPRVTETVSCTTGAGSSGLERAAAFSALISSDSPRSLGGGDATGGGRGGRVVGPGAVQSGKETGRG